MNLGKLLAAGKSIMGGRCEISYRISDSVYLPKFISPKNPFMAAVKPEPSSPAVEPTKKGVASDGKKTQKLPALSVSQPRKYTWIRKLNPFSFMRRSAPRAQQKTQGPTQAELSLDRVKVVHNDLSDADVEIVPIKSRVAPIATEATESALATASRGDSWSRLGAKIFGIKTV